MKEKNGPAYYIMLTLIIVFLIYGLLGGCTSKTERDYYFEPDKTNEFHEYMGNR